MAYSYQITVRPVTRYIISEYVEDGDPNGIRGGSQVGEFDCPRHAEEMAMARGVWRRADVEVAGVEVIEGVIGCDDDIPPDSPRRKIL